MSYERGVFDPLLGFIEDFAEANGAQIQAQAHAVRAEMSRPILEGLPAAGSRAAQFQLIRAAVERGIDMFRTAVAPVSKETLMSIARRAPSVYLDNADLRLATLLVKYAVSDSSTSFSTTGTEQHDLHLVFTGAEVFEAFRLMAMATSIDNLEGMARWLGKGGSLVALEKGELRVEMPEEVRAAVDAYERRRPRQSVFHAGGFFLRQPLPSEWSEWRAPSLVMLDKPRFFESPKGSQRWLLFERWPTMVDAGGLARLLRGYDGPIRESWGISADHVLHFLTALATLVHYSSPKIASIDDDRGAFAPAASPAEFEHHVGFVFGLERKGFLRLPRAGLIEQIGRVRTTLAPDSMTGSRLAAEFIDAFLFRPDQAELVDPSVARHTPFLHPSTDDHVYLDLLLLWDFLAGMLEGAKQWYASQHGDRFVLDLKQWLDREVPGFVLGAKLPVPLPNGAMSDADLIVKASDGVWVVECKSYGKSREFMIGAPDAVSARRRKIRDAVAQADRIVEALAASIAAGATPFPIDTRVTAVVCTPSVEFLKPLDEHGMVTESIPRVMTPEELMMVASALRASRAI